MNTARLRSKRVILPTVAVAALGIGGAAWASTGGPGLQGGEADRAGSAATQAVGGGTVTEVEADDDLAGGYEVEVRRSDGSEVDVTLDKNLKVLTHSADDDGDDDKSDDADGDDSDSTDRPLNASERRSAEKAALAAVGSGTVTDLEADDDSDHAYEVEVQKADGTEWEVELDAGFTVLQKSVDD